MAAGERRVRERAERVAAQQADAVADLLALPDLGAHASRWVADFWRAHGEGPLWREVGAAAGVARTVRTPLIEHLAAAGWLRTGSAARTLRPGPRHTGPGPTPWDRLDHPTESRSGVPWGECDRLGDRVAPSSLFTEPGAASGRGAPGLDHRGRA